MSRRIQFTVTTAITRPKKLGLLFIRRSNRRLVANLRGALIKIDSSEAISAGPTRAAAAATDLVVKRDHMLADHSFEKAPHHQDLEARWICIEEATACFPDDAPRPLEHAGHAESIRTACPNGGIRTGGTLRPSARPAAQPTPRKNRDRAVKGHRHAGWAQTSSIEFCLTTVDGHRRDPPAPIDSIPAVCCFTWNVLPLHVALFQMAEVPADLRNCFLS